ncbi:unnamed protein product [Mytilus edulis]|uniref:Uncharacterized protein n=1 Tax=Mytilus edulis TaxID=6550 RepID=A0A8S3U227_MYTED|nr:unnamed protein product [Mytilus edulis]
MAVLNLYWIDIFCVPFLNGFLLDEKTPTPNTKITDDHFISVIKLVAEETKAKHELETVVAQLHRILLSKTCNNSEQRDQIKLIMALKHEMQGLKNKTDILEQNVHQLKFENSAFAQNYSILLRTNSQLKLDHERFKQKLNSYHNQSSENFKHLNDLKQAQTKGKLQHVKDINILKTNTEALTKQMNSLRSNQVAGGQDFLYLINQTLVFRSDVGHDIAKMSAHNNDFMQGIMQIVQNTNHTCYQIKKDMEITVNRLQQKITDENLGSYNLNRHIITFAEIEMLVFIFLRNQREKARQQLEVAVTQLHQELLTKTSHLPTPNNVTEKCKADLQAMKNYTDNIQGELTAEIKVLKENLSKLQLENNDMKIRSIEESKKVQSDINSLKQLKAIDQLQDVHTLQTRFETIERLVQQLSSVQSARGEDFLALYNQSLKMKSMLTQTTDISNNHSESLIQVRTDLTRARGTTYVRWSRKQCPGNHTELVYSGYAGGGHYDERGSPAEPVCLLPDPDFARTSSGQHGHMWTWNSLAILTCFPLRSQFQDIPCAVRVKQASNVIMIPERTGVIQDGT